MKIKSLTVGLNDIIYLQKKRKWQNTPAYNDFEETSL